jgi:hypothetical protein
LPNPRRKKLLLPTHRGSSGVALLAIQPAVFVLVVAGDKLQLRVRTAAELGLSGRADEQNECNAKCKIRNANESIGPRSSLHFAF